MPVTRNTPYQQTVPAGSVVDKVTPPGQVSDQLEPQAHLGLKPFLWKAEQPHYLIVDKAYRFHIGFRAHSCHRLAVSGANQ
ncbi:hypothetical protein [Pseudomonas tolaasii]|uniref:hypothetical protein n=1 Tax=Pseudomonas tolaasii TaxID=29442 RepID=UPI0002E85D66|nr:hypothetical protein [Pseudomonas tolaasii]